MNKPFCIPLGIRGVKKKNKILNLIQEYNALKVFPAFYKKGFE